MMRRVFSSLALAAALFAAPAFAKHAPPKHPPAKHAVARHTIAKHTPPKHVAAKPLPARPLPHVRIRFVTDSKAQDYTFTGNAIPANAQGFFAVHSTNSAGVNNNDFLILDPFGHELIRSFPVFWIPFAAPGSKLK